MLVRLKREYFLPGVTAFQAMLALAAWQDADTHTALAAQALSASLALLAWLFALRRGRAIDDTPTSRIASAAQGYVELVGVGRPHGELAVLSPYTQLPCLWYRYFVYRRENDKWVYDHGAESRQLFEIDDGSGRCVVDPEGAEVMSWRKETRQQGDWRHVEYLLLAGEPIYALGRFRTVNASDQDLDAARDVAALLSEWKQDQAALKARFDLDRDGEISAEEWQLARSAARREVARQHAERRAAPAWHYLERPEDGRLFLISNIPPKRLARRYFRWAWLQFAILIASLVATSWLWRQT